MFRDSIQQSGYSAYPLVHPSHCTRTRCMWTRMHLRRPAPLLGAHVEIGFLISICIPNGCYVLLGVEALNLANIPIFVKGPVYLHLGTDSHSACALILHAQPHVCNPTRSACIPTHFYQQFMPAVLPVYNLLPAGFALRIEKISTLTTNWTVKHKYTKPVQTPYS
jgi:hypothetical protein